MIELLIMANQNQVIVVCDDHRRRITTLRYCMVNTLVSTTIDYLSVLMSIPMLRRIKDSS